MLIGYRGLTASNVAPRHAFGAGFGYARFTLSEAVLSGSVSGGATVSVSVRNISDVAGSEVVQVYREAPELTLIGFSKIFLRPGESRRAVIDLPRRRFETWQDGWRLIDPPPALFLGTSSVDRQKLAGCLEA
jgi:beta-glucosidase